MHILHKEFGDRNENFVLKLVEYLIDEGMKIRALGTLPQRIVNGLVRSMPNGDHFPEQIPRKEGTKRKPSMPCFACNGLREDIKKKIAKEMFRNMVRNMQKGIMCNTLF